ncbi:hypothetical protein B0H16DRAFT_1584677 [Mycena metata]|uniref:Tetratricopeptide repeat protein n=1 Tax=Mycena metata TaxID=1033252 RepID=A0AAD7HXZ3_9AGAR|nr:hypothetical protein B0H16DRAFT_1584677 [Mycena metata]
MCKACAQKFNERAGEHFRHGEYEQAVASYTSATGVDPTSAVYFSNLAAAYLNRKIPRCRQCSDRRAGAGSQVDQSTVPQSRGC